MTLLQIQDALSGEEQLAEPAGLTVKCSWCGEVIHLDGSELALAMCQTCYERLLREYLRTQHENNASRDASDR